MHMAGLFQNNLLAMESGYVADLVIICNIKAQKLQLRKCIGKRKKKKV